MPRHCWFVFVCFCFPAFLWGQTESKKVLDQSEKKEQVWLFLKAGKPANPPKPDELQSMMQAHLNNFSKLAEAGNLVTAGPLNDPQQVLRGVVLMNSGNPNDLEKYFENDPFVQNGMLNLYGSSVDFKIGSFRTAVTPENLELHNLVVFKAAEKGVSEEKSHADLLSQTLEYLRKPMANSGTAIEAFGVLSGNKENWTAVLVCKGDRAEDTQKLAADVPFVQAQLWTFDVYPLYLSAKVFDQ